MARTTMILTTAGVMSLALALAAGAASAQQMQHQQMQQRQAPGSMASATITTTGTVSAIDKQARTVTLQAADGRQLMLSAPADADLNRLKVGDKVDVEYHQALAVQLQPPGTPMSGPTEQGARQRTATGGAAMREVEVTAEVVSVNPARNEVTFRGPRGNVETIAVQDPTMQEKARQLKPGDKVHFKYTEAAAVSIRPKKSQ